MKIKEWIMLCLKGIAMGAANSVPGVSGGTIAFITGIYERLVGCINNIDATAVRLLFKRDFKGLWSHIDGNFLSGVLLGVMIAMFSFAKLMLVLLSDYPICTWAFFFGLIVASSVIMLGGVKKWGFSDIICILIGGLLGVLVALLNMRGVSFETSDSLWFILLCGALSITAMILPGISGSFILLVLGKYEYIMQVIVDVLKFDLHAIITLCVFGAGCAGGLLAFAKLLHYLMARWGNQTMLVLTGFIIGSLPAIWPWNGFEKVDVLTGEMNDPMIVPAVIWCVVGTALVLGLEYAGRRKK